LLSLEDTFSLSNINTKNMIHVWFMYVYNNTTGTCTKQAHKQVTITFSTMPLPHLHRKSSVLKTCFFSLNFSFTVLGSTKIITIRNSHAPPSILAHCTKTQAKAPQFHCALVPSPCRAGSTHCTLHQCQSLPVPTKHEQHPHAPFDEKTEMCNY